MSKTKNAHSRKDAAKRWAKFMKSLKEEAGASELSKVNLGKLCTGHGVDVISRKTARAILDLPEDFSDADVKAMMKLHYGGRKKMKAVDEPDPREERVSVESEANSDAAVENEKADDEEAGESANIIYIDEEAKQDPEKRVAMTMELMDALRMIKRGLAFLNDMEVSIDVELSKKINI